ncbi:MULTISPECIES: TonB-dependent receptor [unclassified Sphingomonas]|uniref:TonB-dependent receptor n=1 Tax=unclassified Sphingomonas TaxID=196159 RepID=UPI0012E3493A|nr:MULTISPECIES: TonB-dependent receptor [unclassified Sphingomonas]
MRDHLRKAVGTGAATMAMAWLLAGTAHAQTVAGAEAVGEDEIVVTAQKRQERLQEVPISVAVLGGAALDAQSNGGVSEALRNVAGLSLTNTAQGGGSQLTIRGVAANGATLAGSSTTAYYIDSVPFGLVKSAILPDTNAYDMERIEVLRGPQGTLYGANALNGVVRLLTNDAKLDRFELKGRAGVSTTKGGEASYRGDVAVNVPIVEDKLAVRLVAGFENAGGWIEQPNRGIKDANDQKSRNLRVKVNAQPTERLNIGLGVSISRIDQDSPNYANATNVQTTTVPLPQRLDYDAYSARIGYDFDGFTATSATSYLKFANVGERDYTAFGPLQTLHTDIRSKVFTEELLLNSTTSGSWRWSAGAFYRDAKDDLFQTLFLLPAPINFRDKSRSYAVFGQLTKAMFDGRLELSGGLRYFNDRVSQIEVTPVTGNPAQALARRTETFDAVTPRAVITWLPSRNFTAYASYSQGFRSGFNQSPTIIRSAPGIPPVKADRLHNYEVGAKGTMLDGALTFDAAVYYIDWNKIQQNLNVNLNNIVYAVTVNGTGASGLGVDLSLTARPVRGVDIGGTFSWNDLTLDDPVVTQTAGGPVTLYDKGDRLAFSPEYTASGFVDIGFPIGTMEGKLSGSINYRSKIPARLLSAGVVRRFISDAPLTTRASFALKAQNNWTATLFVDNLTNWNKRVQPATDFSQEFRLRPRTIGLQLEFGL